MNFHLDAPKGWLYEGDVNIEYGGTLTKDLSKEFAEDENFSQHVEFAALNEYREMDKQWWFTAGSVHIKRGDPDVEKLLAEGRHEQAFLQASWEGDVSVETEILVQIGKLDQFQSSNPAEPDNLYHGNKKLHNVFLELMGEHL